jgi:peptidylprolyl isomerase
MRALIAASIVILLTAAAAAQHKIPALPDTASAPKKLPSGVTIVDLKVGAGVEAEKGRMIRIHFTGWVTKTQVMFDYRDAKTGALAFRLGEGTVVKGLERGIPGMRVGGRRRVIVPPALGYGSHPTKLVPANSELTYDVELVAVARPGA